MAIATVAPGVQVTTTEPAPEVLTTSTLVGTEAKEPKLMVPRLVTGLLRDVPNAQPLVMVALTVKLLVAAAASKAGEKRIDHEASRKRAHSDIFRPPLPADGNIDRVRIHTGGGCRLHRHPAIHRIPLIGAGTRAAEAGNVVPNRGAWRAGIEVIRHR